jgi:hypothetical protein
MILLAQRRAGRADLRRGARRRRAHVRAHGRACARIAPARPRPRPWPAAPLRYFTGHGPATERDLAYWATPPSRTYAPACIRSATGSTRSTTTGAPSGTPRPDPPRPAGPAATYSSCSTRPTAATRTPAGARRRRRRARARRTAIGWPGRRPARRRHAPHHRRDHVRSTCGPTGPLTHRQVDALERPPSATGGFLRPRRPRLTLP